MLAEGKAKMGSRTGNFWSSNYACYWGTRLASRTRSDASVSLGLKTRSAGPSSAQSPCQDHAREPCIRRLDAPVQFAARWSRGSWQRTTVRPCSRSSCSPPSSARTRWRVPVKPLLLQAVCNSCSVRRSAEAEACSEESFGSCSDRNRDGAELKLQQSGVAAVPGFREK